MDHPIGLELVFFWVAAVLVLSQNDWHFPPFFVFPEGARELALFLIVTAFSTPDGVLRSPLLEASVELLF
jgi:hypothetical protein